MLMNQNVKDVIMQGHVKNVWKDILHALSGLVFLPVWYAQKWYKRDKHLWVFGAWDGIRYSDNSRALYEYLIENHPEIRAVWMTRSEEIYKKLLSEGKPVAMCDTEEGKRIQRNAGYFFMTKGLEDADVRYMNGIRFINLWHGMPLKKIGKDAMKPISEQGLLKRFKTWCRRFLLPWEFILDNSITTALPFFVTITQSAFALPANRIIQVPSPRLCKLTGTKGGTFAQQLNQRFDYPLKIMYMPTHRDNQWGKFNPFDEKLSFDMNRFSAVLEKNNMVFLYKGHFYDNIHHEKAIVNDERRRFIEVNEEDYDDLYAFLNNIDILITDYSSIYFDFLYLRRPIVLFPFDMDDYIANSRAFYFDYKLMEAKKVYSWSELEDCLTQKTYFPPSEGEWQRFCTISNVGCCERLIEAIHE